jgi:hypothetical protein
VLADAATGLASPDVSYIGNQIGETGDNAGNTFVNAGDFIGVRDHPANLSNRALPSNPYDFNHDSFVNATDLIITRDNANNFQTAIKLIAPTSTVPSAASSVSAPISHSSTVVAAPALPIAASSLSDNVSGTTVAITRHRRRALSGYSRARYILKLLHADRHR